jgi:outer membrane protein insertion porin family
MNKRELNYALFKNAFIYCFCIFIFSCSGTHKLPEGQVLYTGSEIKVTGSGKHKKKKIINEASRALAPRPNGKFLGMRPKLALYNSIRDSTKTKSKFNRWLKYKVGEPPVLITDALPEKISKVIDARLFNTGIFNGTTQYEIVRKKNTAKIVYQLQVHDPFKISGYSLDTQEADVTRDIRESMTKTLIAPGQDYDLQMLKNERSRIDFFLKERGYYYFRPDYLIFKADSSFNEKTIYLRLSVKSDIPQEAFRKYYIRNIYFETDFSLVQNDSILRDTTLSHGIFFIEKEKIIRHKVISRAVFIRSKDLYSQKNHNMTLSRLMSMGNYKFINIKLAEADTSEDGYLDAFISATPGPKRNIRFETDLVTKSNNYTGPALTVSYKNKNSFNGAELFNMNLRGSFETQLTGENKGLSSYEIGPQVELYIPRFIVPFKMKDPKTFYIPKTRFSVSYDYKLRAEYYNMTSLQFLFGYKWQRSLKVSHEFNPVNINFISVNDKSERFQAMLDENYLLAKSYEDQFIAGMNYSFTYNEQVFPEKKIQYYINGTIDLAGNLLSLGKRAFTAQIPSPEEPLTIASKPYAQFARYSLDVRNFIALTKKTKLALRLYGGVGFAYGNSTTLPYNEQFFSGGPNSLRAFRYNSVGPGDYIAPDSIDDFVELGGDVKLEGSVEYRFPIISIFKGALFLDAGNMWLRKPNPDIQADAISKNFYKEIAMGTGVGIRLDITFFVLRFDLAFPIRKPWLPEQERWVFDQVNIGNPDWRKENLILNIAIGYPF